MPSKKGKAKPRMFKAFCPGCGLHWEIEEGTQSVKCPCCQVLLFFDEYWNGTKPIPKTALIARGG